LGDLALREADLAGARRRYEAALAIFPAIGDRLGEANVLQSLGNLALAESDHAAAFERYRAALEIHAAIGNQLGVGASFGYLGRAAGAAGAYAQAALLHDQSLAVHRKIGDRFGQTLNLKDQGDTFWQLGVQQAALAAWWQAREMARRIGLPLARQLDGVFGQVAQAVGAQAFRQLEADLSVHAEEWRQAGVAAARQAVAADQPGA
jgi:tetratricopeptide (TPR) repeat protein